MTGTNGLKTPKDRAKWKVTLPQIPPNVTSGRILGLWRCPTHQIKARDLASSNPPCDIAADQYFGRSNVLTLDMLSPQNSKTKFLRT